jgi:hypothetical protein
MPYSVAFPSSTALADHRAALSDRIAPALNAGDNLDKVHLSQAKKEIDFRNAIGPESVTGEEMLASEIRRHALLTEHAVQSYPGAGAPAWFQEAMGRLDERFDEVKAQNDALKAQNDELKAQNDEVKGQLAAIAHNAKAQARNLHAVLTGSADAQLHKLMKVTPGAGTGIPGVAPAPAAPPPADQVPLPGTMVGDPFPATIKDLRALTTNDLRSLAVFFNDDFGILRGEKPHERNEKFQKFVSGQ